MDLDTWSALCGCAPFADFVFYASELDELVEDTKANSAFFFYDGEAQDDDSGGWRQYDFIADWTAISIASIRPKDKDRLLIALGSNGEYFEANVANGDEESGVIRPSIRGIRRICSIDEEFFAVGMNRLVCKRKKAGVWTEFGPGISPAGKDEVIGFEAVGGFSVGDLYCAGWRGEIWHFNGKKFVQIDSPTSGNLNSLTCGEDGYVYIVGDNGLMLKGRGDSWTAIETNRSENLQDVAYSNGEVFVSTDFKILMLSDDGLVEEERFGDGRPVTCLHLFEAEDGVVSLGPKDLFSFNGKSWKRVL